MSTQQHNKKRKNFSRTLKTEIKRKPHTQPINGVEYTYGTLEKKSQSSLFNNERLLIIKGIESFGYISKLPDDVDIPFLDVEKIPKCKVEVPLEKIDINNEKEVLVIEFQEDNKKQKTRWEFKCGSKAKAIEWRQKLQGAKNQKLASLQNSSIKVILQDPNEHNEQSENHEKIKNKQQTNNNQLNKDQQKFLSNLIQNQKQQRSDTNQLKKENIIVEENNQHEQDKNNTNNEKQKPFNIFDNLLGTSNARLDDSPSKKNNFYADKNVEQNGPQSSYFVGSVAVKSLQEQEQLKNQISLVKNSSLKNNKEQFKRKKKQQNQMQQQLKESSQTFIGGILNTIGDSKFQIEKLKKQWGYEFAKGEKQYELIEHFKVYIETITSKIIDELSLQSRKRYYKPVEENSQSIRYEIDGVSLEFFLNQLSEVSTFNQDKGTIIANEKIKMAYQQLKNYDYVLQITNNKGRIRVPLTMCVEYKGFVGLAKVIIPQSQSYQNIEPLQKQLDLLQAQSRIHNSLFQDSENGRIVPLQNKIYQKISRSQNNPRKFDICYIEGLKYYLPQDFYRFNKNNSVNMLRKQLVQDQEYEDSLFYGENMTKVVNRLKIPQTLKEGVQVLNEVSKTIPDRVNALALALQNLDQVITNSKDLSRLMHGYGLNMRYLGLLLQRVKQNWLKGIIISEISARCAKYFLKFDLQDCILNLNQSKVQNIRRFQVKLVISFLNKLLGNSEQSQSFWNQLSRQSQTYFQCFLDRSLLNVGFFIQSLQTQCRIKLTNINDQIQFFKSSAPLSVDNFGSFEIKSKTYDLGFTELYSTVNTHLKDLSQESYEQLALLLNLKRKGSLPQHFQLNDYAEKIILFMINWLSPSEGRSIYYPENIQFGQILPNKALYQIKLTEIKWLLKEKRQQQSQKVRNWIIEHINRWLGEYHPILSQLYEMYSRYYLGDKNQQKKAVTYCKSGIKNQEKLLGHNHIKLADNYYMLATIYINYQRKIQALNSFKRSKEILQETQSDESQAYGLITLKIGELLLASNETKEALECGIQAYNRLGQSETLENFIECIELIGRCYEVEENWIQYAKFSEQVSNKLQIFSEDTSFLQRAVKVTIFPYFHELSTNIAVSRRLLQILSSFPSSSFSSNLAYEYLKQKILPPIKSFPSQFIKQLSDLQEILDDIETNGIMTRWKGFENVIMNKSLLNKIGSTINVRGFQFLAGLQALNVFLGEGFIEGILRSG